MRRPALLLIPALLAGLLTACSSDSGEGLPDVTGSYGEKPKVKVAKGSTPSKQLEFSVLTEGDGTEVGKGDLLVADYLGEVYGTGKIFDNSYDRDVPAAFPIGVGGVIKGWDKSLVGVKAGSRVLMVVPPKDGYGKEGNPQAGIKGKDSLVFVVDIIASYPKKAVSQKATPVTGLAADLPKVEGELGSEPTVSVPAGTTPPKEPVVTVLAKGAGPEVTKGKLIIVHFSAVSWGGEPLSSSWTQGAPTAVPVGGEQPSPFDLLAGVPAGSRVLMTLPAPTGADATKESVAVVVDVLGVHGPAKEEK